LTGSSDTVIVDRPSPRVVIGAPLYGRAVYLREAADSILAQTYRDFALLLIDDRSDDGTLALAQELAEQDPRVHLVVNDERLGLLGNTNKALALARERFPQAEFWALGSDHDVWHPRWLDALVALLERHPEAVAAYPQTQRIDEHGRPYDRKPPRRSATVAIEPRRRRMHAAFSGMVAGDMVYSLFRMRSLPAAFYRPVLVPDRLLLTELSLQGPFVQTPEVLWKRRFRGLAELDRQRRAFFLDAPPPRYTRLPWWLQHAGALAWAHAVRGEGLPAVGRREGARLAGDYLGLAIALHYRRRLARARRRLRRRLLPIVNLRKTVRRSRRRAINRFGPAVGSWMRRRLQSAARVPALRPVAARSLLMIDGLNTALGGERTAREQDSSELLADR
jgi:glycosyltransferase involved in cell wall biosynthesis